jgi:3-hydroxyisobutyrate dehydrogenase
MKVGFVGLGSQGAPMAQMIQRAGYALHIWARRPVTLEAFAETGAVALDSLAKLGAECEFVGVCVVDDKDVEDVVLGPDGLLGAMRPGSILAIHSTIHPDTCVALAESAAAAGVHVLDAPVSGSGEAALEGRLTVMVGGDEPTFERARAIFETYGHPVRLLGPPGAGQRAKLLNNLAFYSNLRIAGTVLAAGRSFGMDVVALVDILQTSSGQSFAVDMALREMSCETIDHVIGLSQKDLDLAAGILEASGIDASLAKETRQKLFELLDGDYRLRASRD